MEYKSYKKEILGAVGKIRKEAPKPKYLKVLQRDLKKNKTWRHTVTIKKLQRFYEEGRPLLVFGKVVGSIKSEQFKMQNTNIYARAYTLTSYMLLKSKNNKPMTYDQLDEAQKNIKIIK